MAQAAWMTFSILSKVLFIRLIIPVGNKLWCTLCCIQYPHCSHVCVENKTWESSKDFKEAFKKSFRLIATQVRFWMFGSSRLWKLVLCIWNITCWWLWQKKKNPCPVSSILSFAAALPRLPSALIPHCKISTWWAISLNSVIPTCSGWLPTSILPLPQQKHLAFSLCWEGRQILWESCFHVMLAGIYAKWTSQSSFVFFLVFGFHLSLSFLSERMKE